MELAAHERMFLLKTACDAVRAALGGPAPQPTPADRAMAASPSMTQPAGCFVTLHQRRTHALRGCIGRLDANGPLLDTMLSMSQAVLRDPRFSNNPVSLAELATLEVEISILSPLKPAASPLAFEPKRDGIYLTASGRNGCFLPQVAQETGWTREQLLIRLCTEKMGLAPNAWQDPHAVLQTFSTVVLGPRPF
jgi:AmmeMemoRadiSam system protein A